MARWEPDASGRLVRAAMELYAERGFDGATAPEIAQRAGLHERSFFRLFPDKREVLFAGADATQLILTRTIADNSDGKPLDRVARALEAMCAKFQEDPELVRQRDSVISANPDLAERNLAKHAEFVRAMVEVLRKQGVSDVSARLAAEIGMATFVVAFASWVADKNAPDLPGLFRATMDELRSAASESGNG